MVAGQRVPSLVDADRIQVAIGREGIYFDPLVQWPKLQGEPPEVEFVGLNKAKRIFAPCEDEHDLDEALNHLEEVFPRGYEVFYDRAMRGLTLEQVGRKTNISREAVRQTQAKAVRILRRHISSKLRPV